MNEQTFLLIGFMIAGFFGSLSKYTPTIPWSDWTYFFRKDKKSYLAYSTSQYSQVFLKMGSFSLGFLIMSWLLNFELPLHWLIAGYLFYLIVSMIRVELKWRKQQPRH